MLLTIGQLARHCGVTIRAVRHYHQLGLLPEPGRDESGYRRYGASAVVQLIRIKALADAGVPLAEVQRLLDAEEGDFAAAIAAIDRALRVQISHLQRRRRQLNGLLAGDRLVLPAEAADLLAELRAMGVSERTVQVEREGWILLAALNPQLVAEWASDKLLALADPEFRGLYLACDQAQSWEPNDPRLEELAVWMADWLTNRHATTAGMDTGVPANEPGLSLVQGLMAADFASASPAWRRLRALSRSRAKPGTRSTAMPARHG